MAANLDQAIEAVYVSLNSNNEDIDLHIANLKAAAREAGIKDVPFKTDRLPQPNREGRLMMKSYFKKRGVSVVFEK